MLINYLVISILILPLWLIVHGNSNKDFTKQPLVLQNVIKTMTSFPNLIGMLESNLLSGNQKLILGEKHKLKYGISITDSCIDITTTENIVFVHINLLINLLP